METRPTSLATPTIIKPIHRNWAEVDLGALKYNIEQIRATLPASFTIFCVVKSDAYGHGMIPISQTLRKVGITHLAVANVHEGAVLRQSGFTGMILILGPLLKEEDPFLIRYELTPIVSSLAEVKRFEALEKHNPLPVQVKLDTGMARTGALVKDAAKLIKSVQASPTLELTGIATHYSSARTDAEYTQMQRSCFLSFLASLKDVDTDKLLIHTDNSQSIIRLPQDPPMNAVRLGLLCYGHPESVTIHEKAIQLKPVLSLHSRILSFKDLPPGSSIGYHRAHILKDHSRIALVSCGYGDGIPANLSYGGYVLVRGQRAPVCGLVGMDIFAVNITDIPGVKPGDPVTLIGTQGEETITLNDFCEHSGRGYREVSCLLTQRVPRLYA